MAMYRELASFAAAPTAATAPAAAATPVASAESGTTPEKFWLGVAGGLVVAGAVLGMLLYSKWGRLATFTPADGVGTFAVFYVAAQAIERLLELFPILGGDKAAAVAARDAAVATARTNPTTQNRQAAANTQAVVDQRRANRAVAMWGVASFLAIALCGQVGLLLFKAVGLTGAPAWLDMVVTGLVISGGSKPRHDLISHIAKAKEAKEDPQETRS